MVDLLNKIKTKFPRAEYIIGKGSNNPEDIIYLDKTKHILVSKGGFKIISKLSDGDKSSPVFGHENNLLRYLGI